MSPDGSVLVESLWKRFHADRSRPVLRDELERLRKRRSSARRTRWRWALQDVNMRIEPGEAVGLFGSNGSGKSTLLKILTRVMYPTYGSMTAKGRVGALIEVRAGIHPDLTGRENVFLYGSLLGLRRAEVARRFDEIIAFAELEEAVDRQVKFYSSGMSMRLGFGVAAFLNPRILLVDEVLAVGDASFQQKCLNRMRDVLREGTTLVFVSHDLATVEATCSRGVWLDNGRVGADGPVREALAAYRSSIEREAEVDAPSGGPVRLVRCRIRGAMGMNGTTGGPLEVELDLEADFQQNRVVCIGVTEGPSAPVFVLRTDAEIVAGQSVVGCRIGQLPLPRGHYYAWAAVLDGDDGDGSPWRPVGSFEVQGPDEPAPPPGVMRLAPIYVSAEWRVSSDDAGRAPDRAQVDPAR